VSSPLINSLRQGDLPAIPTSLSAWVEIGGVAYAVVRVAVRFSRLEIKAAVDFAVGVNARGDGNLKTLPASFAFLRGTPAKIWLRVDEDVELPWAPAGGDNTLLKKGEHRLIDGVIDDGGPADLADGAFNVRCVIVSKLIYLDTGATHFTSVRGSHLDTTQLAGITHGNSPVVVNAGELQADFWKGITATVVRILTMTRTFTNVGDRIAQFLKFTGGDRNDLPQTAVNAINLIKGGLPTGIFGRTDMARVVAEHIQAELSRDLGRQSIYAKFQAWAEDFFFAIVENGNGIATVPWTPLVHRDDCRPLWPSGVLSAQWVSHDTSLVNGVVFIDNPYGSVTGAPPVRVVNLGGFRRQGTQAGKNDVDVAGDALGLFTPLPAPAWMHARPADGKRLGFSANTRPEAVQAYANGYARELALRQNYRGRIVILRCPLRLDIGPCTPVKIVYPNLPGTNLSESVAVYGSVEAVTLTISAGEKKAVTEMEVMYARSDHQQAIDIDQRPLVGFGGPGSTWGSAKGFHPLWAQPYLGNRLDVPPG
jgi:hypothetical protein